MSYVYSIIVRTTFFNEDKLKSLISIINECSNSNIYFSELSPVILNETGNKCCQFGDLYAFAFNYFNSQKFEEQVINQNFDKSQIQIFIKDENDEFIKEVVK